MTKHKSHLEELDEIIADLERAKKTKDSELKRRAVERIIKLSRRDKQRDKKLGRVSKSDVMRRVKRRRRTRRKRSVWRW